MYPFSISIDERVRLKFLTKCLNHDLITDIFNNRHTTAFENNIN